MQATSPTKSHEKIARVSRKKNNSASAPEPPSEEVKVWPQAGLDDIEKSVIKAMEQGKHLFIWDKTG